MEKKREFFFSNNNFNMIYGLLCSDIQKKFNYNIGHNDNLKDQLFSNMTTCYENNSSKDLKEINILTIKSMAPKFYSQILKKESNLSVIHSESSMYTRNKNNNDISSGVEGRDSELPIRDISLNKKMPEYANIRPKSDNNSKSDVNKQFEKINNDRSFISEKNKEIDFTLPIISEGTNPSELFDQINLERQQENHILDLKKKNKSLQSNYQKEYQNQINSMDKFKEFNSNISPNSDNFSTQINNITDNIPIMNNTPIVNNTSIMNNNPNININEDSSNFDNINKGIEINENPNLKLDSWEDNQNISHVQKRIELDHEIRSSNLNIDPKTIYQENIKLMNDKSEIPSNNNIEPLKIMDSNKDIIKKIIINFLEINSKRRVLNNQNDKINNRYSFRVVFAPAPEEYKRYPMFANNPTILATKEQSQRGQRGDKNINGWFDNQGNNYPAYDVTKPYGDIVNYEDILFSTTNNLQVGKIYRNVRKIRLVELMIPLEYLINPGAADPIEPESLNIPALSENYLLVDIDEINNVYDSNSTEISNSFARVTRFHGVRGPIRFPIQSDKDDSFNYLGAITFRTPSNNVMKDYFPAPLASLGSLTIKILKPNGQILSLEKDHVAIRCIYYNSHSNPDNRSLTILLNDFVSRFIFPEKSRILIRDYMIPNHNPDFIAKGNFEAFINDQYGHEIISLMSSETNSKRFGYINKIIISSQGSMDYQTGEYKVYNYGSQKIFDNLLNNLILVHDKYKDQPIPDYLLFPYGSLLSLTFQTSISFEISTEEGDFNETKTKVIETELVPSI